MSPITSLNGLRREPHVAVCVDKTRAYGRGILMGLADYLETVRRWSLYIDFHSEGQLSPRWLRRWRGDGILAYVREPELIRRLSRSGIPTVETYGLIDVGGLPRVGIDDFAVGRMAGEHFLERRFRHFAYTGFGDSWSDEQRYQGFVRVVGAQQCSRFNYPRHPPTPAEWERYQARLGEWLQGLPQPVGVMAFTDPHAVRVLDACRRGGLAVPERIAVIGVDNDEEMCRLSDPPLSSVVNNSRKIGFEAARRLDQLMTGQLTAANAAAVVIPPLHVVTRRSTDILAIEDTLVAQALAFINRRVFDPIGVLEVARALRTSRKTLYRHFEEALGRTPHDEILRLRLQRTKVLLSETTLGLDEIARSSGFGNASNLSHVFKKNVGLTPGEYRGGVQPR